MLSLIFVLVLAGAYLYKSLLHPSPLSKIPTAHWSCSFSPFLILWKRYTENANRFIHDAHLRKGPVIRLSPNEISLNSLEGLKIVYAGGWEKHDFYSVFTNYGGVRNMFTMLDSSAHSQRKRYLSNIYSKSHLLASPHLPRIHSTVLYERALPRLRAASKSGTAIELELFLSCVTMDSMSAYVFGLPCGTNFVENPHLFQAFEVMYVERGKYAFWAQEVPVVAAMAKTLGIGGFSPKATAARKVVDRLCLDLYEKAKERLDNGEMEGEEGVVFRQLKSSVERGLEKKGFPSDSIEARNMIASEILDHLLAGFNTSAIALTYAIYHLSAEPAAQARLRAELAALPDHTDRNLDTAAPYLVALVTETLRLDAPIPGAQPRIAPRASAHTPQLLHGYGPVPPGTRVSAQAYSLHRNAEVFPEPEAWRPERWLPASASSSSMPGAGGDDDDDDDAERLRAQQRWFWAFGSGGRMCIGSHFALLVMRATLAAFYSEFETGIEDASCIEQMDGYNVGPKGKVLINFRELKG